MPSPSTTWDCVRIYGTWHGMDGALLAGTYTVTLPARVTDVTDDVIIPAGAFAKNVPLTTAGSGPSLDFMCPATDDPDIQQSGWRVQLDVTFSGGQAKESYTIDVPYANRPTAAGGNGLGVNLRCCAMPAAITQQVSQYKVGVPGGLATLDSSGQVVDANGDPVTGGGGGTGAVDSVNGRTGAVVLAASDVGALPSSYVPAWSSITGKPTLGTASAAATTDFDPAGAAAAVTAASIGAVPTTRTVNGKSLSANVSLTAADVGAATAAQGAKADSAVQPSGLTKTAVGLGNVDNTSDLAKPISTATQTALDGKAGTSDVITDISQLTGKETASQLISGGVLSIGFTSANYQSLARPTSRTDVRVIWVGDSTTSASTIPTNRIAGDLTFTTQT